MLAYDDVHFDPPAPVARVTPRDPQTGTRSGDIELLVDSGADVTLVPKATADALALVPGPTDRYELMGFDGSRSFAPAVVLDLILQGKAFRGRYLLIDASIGVLGRDVLNHLLIVLNGPGLCWSQQNPQPS
jgi:hypothetical protein